MPDLNKLAFTLTSPKSNDDFKRYYQFRWEQLRRPLDLPFGSEQDPLDEKSFHCMVIINQDELVGIGSIQPAEINSMRIRYMAVSKEFQRLGIGSAIIKNLLEYANENHAIKCWLNARSNVLEFYKQQGFKVVGEVEAEISIPHFKMETLLKA
ncbi:MAG: GNAT family N-acetyltransferase [Gammaproteobacteria bacterium]|nr:GNAT family N-acetyltransferase [Gammaproteobacteria bacterium]